MKFFVEHSDFLKALTHVNSVVEKRTTIPILANVKIEAKDNTISLTATDLNMDLVETIPANVTKKGVVTISANKLYNSIKEAPQGQQIQVESVANSDQVSVMYGRTKFKLASLPVDDFPTIVSDKLPHEFSMPLSDLHSLLKKTEFAMSTDETRYYLNGVYLHVEKINENTSVIRAVSTDGHRLACVDYPMPKDAKNIDGIIIPKKTVHELVKLLEGEGEVEISLSKSRVMFEFSNLIVASKIVDGTFPDYRRVIPKDADNNNRLKIEPSTLITSIRKVSSVVEDKVRVIKFSFNDKNLVLSSSDSNNIGEDELEIQNSIAKIDIGFNVNYLQEILHALGEDMSMEFNTSSSPVLMRSEKVANVVYVLMPVRI